MVETDISATTCPADVKAYLDGLTATLGPYDPTFEVSAEGSASRQAHRARMKALNQEESAVECNDTDFSWTVNIIDGFPVDQGILTPPLSHVHS